MTEVKTYYYTDGNTVRQVEQPLPDRHTREREIREERERKRRQARRKAQAAMRPQTCLFYVYCIRGSCIGGSFCRLYQSDQQHHDTYG